ncbi:MAG: BofC C-terminal domain-containing protein [Kineosporiaceae bacterium]|nr:BofC C-terminal domain-containing protein [Aeromicrobium sp.]
MTELTYHYVALTDTGLRRTDNEDSGFASKNLLVIADGMGGAAAGEVASSETMHVIRKLDRELEGDAIEALAGAVSRANDRLGELIEEDPAVEGMGTTLDALLWDGKKFAMAHIGDSRAYRLRDGKLTQISDDHTFVQSLVDEGRLTPEEARHHPHRSLILRALLGRDDNDPDISTVEAKLGDRYLLCSDGLSDMVDDNVIEATLGVETIDFAATELIRLALEGGGYDNVTVVIAEMVAAETPIDETLSSSNGQPQLVGAAAGQHRPRTGRSADPVARAKGDAAKDDVPAKPLDPEEVRYMSRPPSSRRWVRWAVGLLVLAAILGGAGKIAYDWSQKQYFVATDNGMVTIFRGVHAEIPGVKLENVDTVTNIDVSTLPEFRRKQVRSGIEASSRADAQDIVDNLGQFVTPAPAPAATPSPTPTPTAKTTRADIQTTSQRLVEDS